MEKELRKVYSNQSVKATPIGWVDRTAVQEEVETEEEFNERAYQLYHKLTVKYFLPEIYAQVVVLKFMYNFNYSDIKEELNMPHIQTAIRAYQKAIMLLKERGYE